MSRSSIARDRDSRESYQHETEAKPVQFADAPWSTLKAKGDSAEFCGRAFSEPNQRSVLV
jgi:hypothetical protein